jgi:hypothetical protein
MSNGKIHDGIDEPIAQLEVCTRIQGSTYELGNIDTYIL